MKPSERDNAAIWPPSSVDSFEELAIELLKELGEADADPDDLISNHESVDWQAAADGDVAELVRLSPRSSAPISLDGRSPTAMVRQLNHRDQAMTDHLGAGHHPVR